MVAEAEQKAEPTTEEQVALLVRCVQKLQASLIRAHQKLIELEADMGAAGIGAKAEKKSALILPERMQ